MLTREDDIDANALRRRGVGSSPRALGIGP